MFLPRLSSFSPAAALTAVLLASVSLYGCGDDGSGGDSGALDGGVDGAADGGAQVIAPDIPWLEEGTPPVMLAPCPAGWREVTGGLVTECDPYPEGGPETCEAGEAHFPGEAGCRPIGDACPAGDYASTLPTDTPILYVKEGAPAGGDGSLGSPFGELSDIPWFSLTADTTVALAKGSYGGTVPLRAGVQLVGACVRDTVLTGVDTTVASVVILANRGEPAGLRNLSFVDVGRFAVLVDAGQAIELDGVLVDRATNAGLVAAGRDASLTLTNTVVRATRPSPGSSSGGRGIGIQDGAHLEASRFIVSDNEAGGLTAFNIGTEVTVTDGSLGGTHAEGASPRANVGLQVAQGAHLVGSRLLMANNHAMAVLVEHEGTRVELSDSVARNSRPLRPDGSFGRGFSIQRGASFEGSRLLIAENRDVGVFIGQAGTTVTLSDVVIRDTQPRENDLNQGRGVVVQEGGHLEATNMLLKANQELAMALFDEGSTARLTDVAIRDTRPQESNDLWGRGLNVAERASLEASRLLVSGSHDVGVYASAAGTTMTLTDVVIENTQSRPTDGTGGKALQLQDPVMVEGSRVRIDGARSTGVMLIKGAVGIFEDLEIRNVLHAACEATTCPTTALGYALGSAGSTLDVARFEVTGAATCGVFLAPYEGLDLPSSIDLQSGSVSSSPIGACVQVDGYNFDRLTNDVFYLDNEINLDTTTLPVPGVSPDVGP